MLSVPLINRENKSVLLDILQPQMAQSIVLDYTQNSQPLACLEVIGAIWLEHGGELKVRWTA